MSKSTNQKSKYQASKKTAKNSNYSTDKEKVVWCFDMIDRSGKFAFDLNRDDFNVKEVMSKMIDYNSMTWQEVKKQTHDNKKSKHHPLPIESLSTEAINRFKARHLDEHSDSVFSFALQNTLRIIGIRKGRHFHVIWYDPHHEVYPVGKKRT